MRMKKQLNQRMVGGSHNVAIIGAITIMTH